MRRVLQDDALQKQFDKDGFVVVDLLSEEEIPQLKELLGALLQETEETSFGTESDYKLSFFSDDPEYRKRVYDKVTDFFMTRVNKYLDDYAPLIINFFNKVPGAGEVPVHQNWTFVDESKYTSVSVWVPLVNVTRTNGTLEFVRGSQKVLAPYRSPSIPWVFEDLYGPLRDKYLEPLNLKVGQVAILCDSILHWSSKNDSEKNRPAIQLIMNPADAMPIHYYRHPEKQDEIEIFKVDSEFFTKFDMKDKPRDVESVGHLPYKYHLLTEEEMVEKIAVNNPGIREILNA